MNNYFSKWMIVLILGVTAISLKATVNPEATEKKTFKVAFRVYGIPSGDFKNIGFSPDAKKFNSVPFKAKQRSTQFEATLSSENPVLAFYRKQTTALEQPDAPVFSKVGSVRLESGMQDVLLIFIPNPADDSNQKFLIHKVPDSKNAFPTGSLSILNLTGTEIIGKFHQTNVKLKSGFCSPAGALSAEGQTFVQIAVPSPSGYHMVYRHHLRIHPEKRALLILSPPARRGSLRIEGHLLMESPSPEKPK